MKQLVTFFILFMLALSLIQAQESAYEITLADRTAAATHVFTGKVKQSRAFWLEASRKIYTAHKIEVFTLYKGSLSGTTLELITEGGITEDRFSIVCPGVNLQVGDQGLFFAQSSAYPSQFATSGQVEIYAGPAGYIEYAYDRVNPPARGFYRSYENVEAELIAPIQALTQQAAQQVSLTEGERRVQAWLGQRGQVATRSDWGIEYYFGYPQITGSNGQYLEFDIEARVTGGSYEYGNAEIYLEYDTVGFLSNVAASGMITVTKGDITTSSDYAIFVTDEQPDRLKIEIAAADPPIALGEVDGWLEDVIHVKIDISQLTQQIELSFESLLMDGESEYYDPASGTYAQFPFVFAYDSIAGTSGSFTVAEIIEFFPDTVRAGVRDTLVIVGNDFGAVKGKVYFRDADVHTTTPEIYMAAPDEAVIWGANMIKVAVPSTDIGNTSPAGTGRFIVEDANGNRDTSISNLFIYYSVQNAYFSNNAIRRANLSSVNNRGGYTIQVESRLADTLDASLLIDRAIEEWNCATKVNFTRGPDTSLSGAFVDSISLVSLSSGALPGGAKTSIGGNRITTCNGNQEFYSYEFDIEINPFLPYNYRDTLPDLVEKDFYTAILHELGHGHMIDHVLEPTAIMWPHIEFGQRRGIVINDTLAGLDVMGHNGILNALGCGNAMAPLACGVNSLEDNQNLWFKAYPNPTSGQMNLVFSNHLLGEREGIIALYDLQGRRLFVDRLQFQGSSVHEINIPEYIQPGVYFLMFQTSRRQVSTQIVIEEK